MLCEAWADYCATRKVGGKNGANAFDRWRKLAREFGLTPAARANLAFEKENPDENRGKARFFNSG